MTVQRLTPMSFDLAGPRCGQAVEGGGQRWALFITKPCGIKLDAIVTYGMGFKVMSWPHNDNRRDDDAR